MSFKQTVTGDQQFPLDKFFCGLMVTDMDQKIVYANSYFANELNWPIDEIYNKNLRTLFSKSSIIFCESYIYPLLANQNRCEEIQLTVLSAKGETIPVIVSAKADKDDKMEGFIYWSLFNASSRDKLYDKLLKTRNDLEDKTKKLHALSTIDELTNLLNRRAFNMRSDIAISTAIRSNQTTSILMIDIDNFKNINDKLGHPEGDKVLSNIGKILSTVGRESDIVSRYGGEEFLLLLPNTDSDLVWTTAERLHKKINMLTTNGAPITASIGASTITEADLLSIEELLRQADKALYQAKSSGKNRTIAYKN